MARVAYNKFGSCYKNGCGIAGIVIEEIAPLFADAFALENVILPKYFLFVTKVVTNPEYFCQKFKGYGIIDCYFLC